MYFSASLLEYLKLTYAISIVEIQPVQSKERSLTIEKSHNNSHFRQIEPMRLRIAGELFRKCLSNDIEQRWNCPLGLVGRSPVGIFGTQLSWNLRKNYIFMHVLEISVNRVSTEGNKIFH